MGFRFKDNVPVVEQLKNITLEDAKGLWKLFGYDKSKLPKNAQAQINRWYEDVLSETDREWLKALIEAEQQAQEAQAEVTEEQILRLAERILCSRKYLPPHFNKVFICSQCGVSGRSEYYEERGECPFCFAQEQWGDDNRHLRGRD
jgi:hypothetical protein